MPNLNLTKQSVGERFWVDRTRLGHTQAKVAKRLGISERKYNHVERDLAEYEYEYAPPPASTDPVHLLPLARRRDGRDLHTLAAELGAGSHVTLLAWERSADPRLIRAWKRLKYRF